MANNPAAIKRIRQAAKHREHNRKQRSEVRTAIRSLRTMIADGQTDEAKQALPGALSLIDRTAGKGILHANTAARTKSRLVAAVKRIS